MRTRSVSLLCGLLFAGTFACSLSIAPALRAQGGGNPFLNESNPGSYDAMRAALVKYTYKWNPGFNSDESVKLEPGGTGMHIGGTTHFDIRWHIKNAQEIEISRADDPNQKPARIKFSADYSTFSGMDFGGGRIVNGFQIIPKGTASPAGASPKPGASAPPPLGSRNTNDDLRKSISKGHYSWESGTDKEKTITFDANGSGIQSSFKFKWRVITPQQIEIVAENSIYGKAKAVLNFSDDYSSYTGTSFDGTTGLTGRQSQ